MCDIEVKLEYISKIIIITCINTCDLPATSLERTCYHSPNVNKIEVYQTTCIYSLYST